MKKYLFIATALAALASCSDDTFVGDQGLKEANENGRAIGFNLNTPAVTRATGSEAAGLLNSNFVVFGYKSASSSDQTVFDNYQVNWVTNTAETTESNSADWEYVGYTSKATTPITQSIKYWDYNASAYDFFAYSLGAGVDDDSDASTQNVFATANVMTNSTYTLTGDQAKLGTCYISKKKHMESLSSSTTQVDLVFLNFLSKIQLKFYETIPGYSVKNLKFYIADNTKSDGAETGDGLAPALYTASTIPTGGTYTITFDANYDPVVTLTGSASSTATSVLFEPVTPAVAVPATPAVWLSGYAGKDYQETNETVYLGRESNAATASKQITILPNSTGAVMTLKMDYTLLSRDGTGETIQVTGATATIPANYTAWKPNYAYTYLFKITDDKLVPITLDAIVTETADGSQTTITTVDNPSITTYQNGAVTNEYSAGNIYVVVGNGTVLTAGTNANLYTATIEDGAAQGLDASGNVAITEAQVANALTNTPDNNVYTVTDAKGKKLTVTKITSGDDALTGGLTAIPADDAPGGKELSINCAKFNATDAKVYVFEYINTEANTKHYKVIKVGTPVAVTTTPNP